MDNKTNAKKKYSVEELVVIGDHIHNASCSFIMCVNDLDDTDNKKSILFSSHGRKDDMVTMFVSVLEKNPKIENLMIEAIAMYNITKENKKNR